ncbi:MAG: hypothetical protein KDD76_03205 [Rickettsiales bacterium]|nr:hypothetical protein [Rickettsiales bacterium]
MIFVDFWNAKEETEDDRAYRPVEDAKEILETADYNILKAARAAYLDIKKSDDAYDPDYEEAYKMALPTWQALEAVIEHGDFQALPKDKAELLPILRKGHLVFFDILHLLIDHHADKEEAEKLFKQYPELHQSIPDKYDNPQQMIQVLVEGVREYQWQLEHYSDKYNEDIQKAYNLIKAESAAKPTIRKRTKKSTGE